MNFYAFFQSFHILLSHTRSCTLGKTDYVLYFSYEKPIPDISSFQCESFLYATELCIKCTFMSRITTCSFISTVMVGCN